MTISCPVCSTDCSDNILHRYDAESAAAHFCSSTRNADRNRRLVACIRRLWSDEECTVLQCQSCGFAFGSPFVGGDEEFYAILHEQKGYPAWRWDYDEAITRVLTPTGGGEILDIGAGEGFFLSKLGPEWNGCAAEGSDTTRKILEDKGISVFPSLHRATAHRASSFDVITLFQVLEHLADFPEVLQSCRKLIKPTGKLIITVPDGEAMILQEAVTGCSDMPPNHISKWSLQSLTRALEQSGFEVTQDFHEPGSLKKIQSAIYLRVLADAANPRSLTAQVYRIPNKRIRGPLLMLFGPAALLRMLPHLKSLTKGGAFGVVAVPYEQR